MQASFYVMKIGKVTSLPLTPPHQKINMCIQLEILDTVPVQIPYPTLARFNSPPPIFCQIPYSLCTDTSQMPMSCRGGRDLEALN